MAPNLSDILLQRQAAYRALFLQKEKRALRWYQKAALWLLPERYSTQSIEDLTWAARIVLEDLISFCNVNESVFDTDTHIMAFQSGKREVAQRILANLHIDLGDVVSSTQPEGNENG